MDFDFLRTFNWVLTQMDFDLKAYVDQVVELLVHRIFELLVHRIFVLIVKLELEG